MNQGGGGLQSAGSQGGGGLPSAGESHPPLRAGMRLAGDFTLLRPLGEGGMGVVWLAREDPPGRDVALKAMKPSESAARLLRFEREASALAALDHPSILPVLRTGVDPATGIPFLVTKALLLRHADILRLCDEVWRCPYPTGFEPGTQGGGGLQSAGGSLSPPRPLTLADLLNDGKALPEAAVLAIARDVADALRAAHAAGVIHRDVKPSNILFDASGRAHLADFGLAKFLEASAESSGGAAPRPLQTISLDESGRRKFLGSPAYAAPELFRGGAATPALDWYSFGAVLYEALTGEKPRSLRAPSSYDPDRISKAWDRFLSALLDSDPSRRLADPAAIFRALDRIARRPARSRHRRIIVLLFPVIAAVLAIASQRGGGLQSAVENQGEGGLQSAVENDNGGLETSSPVVGAARSAARKAPPPSVVSNAETTPAAAPDLHLEFVDNGDQLAFVNNSVPPVPPLLLHPAVPPPPRDASLPPTDDRAPLQLLNVFAVKSITRLEIDAFHGAGRRVEPGLLKNLHAGTAAWNTWIDSGDARDLAAAATAFEKAAAIAVEAADSAESPSPEALVRAALLLERQAWTRMAAGDSAAAIADFARALSAIAPLAKADAPRFAPLRAWLLSDRACAECAAGLFSESLADLREAVELWEAHPGYAIGTLSNAFDPCRHAELAILHASVGAMARKTGDAALAASASARAVELLEPFLAQGGAGEYGVSALSALLDACRARAK